MDFMRENVIDWLLWALFSSDRKHAPPEWREEIDGYVTSIERLMGKKLQHGHHQNVKSMRVTLDPVVMAHRPLLWYAVSLHLPTDVIWETAVHIVSRLSQLSIHIHRCHYTGLDLDIMQRENGFRYSLLVR
jgi:hypothetical protein